MQEAAKRLQTLTVQEKSDILSPKHISDYRNEVIAEMKKMGATPQEISLLKKEMIINSIKRNRKPEDVAWAILA